jgi:hypothetical protein
MDAHLLGAPVGFIDSISASNSLAESDPVALLALLQGTAPPPAASAAAAALAGARAALAYVVAGAQKHKTFGEALDASLRRFGGARPALAAALVKAAAAAGAPAAEGPPVGAAPALLGVDWALCAPVAASAGLVAAPSVTVQLHVRAEGGGVETRALQLSLPQLALLEAAVREASLSLERA